MKHYLGIDIGGTAVKLGIVDETGAVPTGQRLVGGSGPVAPAAASHGGSDATSGASDAGGHGGDAAPAADATSGASSY